MSGAMVAESSHIPHHVIAEEPTFAPKKIRIIKNIKSKPIAPAPIQIKNFGILFLGTGGIIGGAFFGACTEEDIGGIDCDWSVFSNIFSGGMANLLLSLAKWHHIGIRRFRSVFISIPI